MEDMCGILVLLSFILCSSKDNNNKSREQTENRKDDRSEKERKGQQNIYVQANLHLFRKFDFPHLERIEKMNLFWVEGYSC